MVAFATVEDLAGVLGTPIPTERQAQAALMLELASAAIQTETRQTIAYVAGDTIELHPQRTSRTIQLPERPVIAVSALSIGGFTVPDGSFEFTRWGRVRTLADFTDSSSWVVNAPFIDDADWPPLVVVTYDHGYDGYDDPIPDDIRGVCLAVAARAMANPEGYSTEQVGQAYQAQGVDLTDGEKRLIRRYRPAS